MPVPLPHQTTLDRILSILKQDERLLGVAIAGSYVDGSMDEYSDLDLMIVVEEDHYERVMAARLEIASSLGTLLAAFTGEHVGEPRLLVCLYDQPLIHVDLKFVRLQDFQADRVEDPIVLWERGTLLTDAVRSNPQSYPPIDPQWMEDRFWVWVHYCAAKIGRGELFEAIACLSFLREQVLAPCAKAEARLRPRGVRALEQELPHYLIDFCQTLPTEYEPREISRALQHTIDFYRQLRDRASVAALIRRTDAENAAEGYLQSLLK